MMMKGNAMREITDFEREWVSEIAGYKVSDEEVREFMMDLERYEESLEISPELFTGD